MMASPFEHAWQLLKSTEREDSESDLSDRLEARVQDLQRQGQLAEHFKEADKLVPEGAHQEYVQSIINHLGLNPKRMSNNAYVDLTSPYWNARDNAWADGASAEDSRALGYQSLANHYGVEEPDWKWW